MSAYRQVSPHSGPPSDAENERSNDNHSDAAVSDEGFDSGSQGSQSADRKSPHRPAGPPPRDTAAEETSNDGVAWSAHVRDAFYRPVDESWVVTPERSEKKTFVEGSKSGWEYKTSDGLSGGMWIETPKGGGRKDTGGWSITADGTIITFFTDAKEWTEGETKQETNETRPGYSQIRHWGAPLGDNQLQAELYAVRSQVIEQLDHSVDVSNKGE